MSLGSGLAIGMGTGIACGIAAGMASGRRRAREEILEYSRRHGIVIQNAEGQTLSINQFLDAAVGFDSLKSKKIPLVIGVGLALLALGGLLALFYFRSQSP